MFYIELSKSFGAAMLFKAPLPFATTVLLLDKGSTFLCYVLELDLVSKKC